MNSPTVAHLRDATKPSALLQLPREIRDMIYGFAIVVETDDNDAYDVLIGFWGNRSTTRPSMLCAGTSTAVALMYHRLSACVVRCEQTALPRGYSGVHQQPLLYSRRL
jgi:hypothetical protein